MPSKRVEGGFAPHLLEGALGWLGRPELNTDLTNSCHIDKFISHLCFTIVNNLSNTVEYGRNGVQTKENPVCDFVTDDDVSGHFSLSKFEG